MEYTVAVREKGNSRWLYVDCNLNVTDSPQDCKPLSKTDAEAAKRMFVAGAAKHGRPIIARVVRL